MFISIPWLIFFILNISGFTLAFASNVKGMTKANTILFQKIGFVFIAVGFFASLFGIEVE